MFGLTRVINFVISGNAIISTLPTQFANLGSSLAATLRIDIGSNKFYGFLPSSLNTMTGVRFLYLDNNMFSGSIPYLGSLTQLWKLSLGNNQLSGSIGNVGFNSMNQLAYLNLGGNNFTGTVPNFTMPLEYLDISGNQFSGQLPDFSFNGNLKTFYAHNNLFSGFVPPFLKRYTGVLTLYGNNFQCPFPPCDVGYACTLQTLNLTCQCACVGGVCLYQQPGCLCNSGWYGYYCDQLCPGFDGVNTSTICNGHGTCVDGTSGTGMCNCDILNGYGGSSCQKQCAGISYQGSSIAYCSGNGLCVDGSCSCQGNWYGEACNVCAPGWSTPSQDCTVPCNGGANNPCNGHGVCLSSDGTCNCNAYYSGTACETFTNVSEIAGLSMFGIIMLAILVFLVILIVSIILKKFYSTETAKLLKEVDEGALHRGHKPLTKRGKSLRKFYSWIGPRGEKE